MKYELRHLSFGETLGQAFNLYFANFIPLFMISLISSLPAIIFLHTSGMGVKGLYVTPSPLTLIIFSFLFIVVNILCTALMIEFISKKYLKQPQDIGQYIRNVLPFIFPIIGLSILAVLIVGGPVLLIALIGGSNKDFFVLLTFLYIVPGTYLVLGLILSPQVLIVERKKVIESIQRSFFLTRGSKLVIFGFLMVIGMLNLVLTRWVVPEIITRFIIRMNMAYQTKLTVAYTIAHLTDILLNPITACLIILIYFNLRIEKEGFDLEHLVDQFGSPVPGESK